jgi:glycosyltransferase involved in cell wall biosynthesis
MLEAMYMGLPVIVSDHVGLWRTIQDENCGFAAKLEVDSLTNALLKMADDPSRRVMGVRGRNLILSRFTWKKIAVDLINAIKAGQ